MFCSPMVLIISICVQSQRILPRPYLLQAEVAPAQPAVAQLAVLHGLCMNPIHVAAGRGGTAQSAVAEHVVLHGLCMNPTHVVLQAEVALLQSEVVEHVALHGLCMNLTRVAAGRGGSGSASGGRACGATRLDHSAGPRPAHHLSCGHELQHLRPGGHHWPSRCQQAAAARHHQA